MDLVDKNRLIDVFMESKGKYIPCFDTQGNDIYGDYVPNSYHSNWDLLMDVVEKIESSTDYTVIIQGIGGCSITNSIDSINTFKVDIDCDNKRDAVFNAITSFIEWYNK